MSNKIKPFSLAVQELRMILLLPLLSIAVVAAATEAVYAVAPALALAFAAPTSIALLKSGSMQNSLESLVFHYSQQAIHCCCFALLCFAFATALAAAPIQVAILHLSQMFRLLDSTQWSRLAYTVWVLSDCSNATVWRLTEQRNPAQTILKYTNSVLLKPLLAVVWVSEKDREREREAARQRKRYSSCLYWLDRQSLARQT